MKSTFIDNKIVVEFDIGEYDKDVMDFLTMKEISKKSKASEKDIQNLARKISSDWWKKNKDRLLNENRS
jgi:hypothetical protein